MSFEPTGTPPTGSNEPVMSRLRVLIVDEDLDSRVSLRRSAQRAQLEVVGESGYGTEAVSLAVETLPDAILVAVEEPAARALDAADSLANALPETPILLYSSASDPESIRRGMVFGARDYLVKPVDATRLREALRVALSQEERRQMRRAGQLSSVGSRGTVITVSGAKGGVGKSVVSANLAVALRQETGRSVVVLDADTQFGDAATLFDVLPTHTVKDVVQRRTELDRTNVHEFVTPHVTGVDIVAASDAEDVWFYCSTEEVNRIIDAYARVYDYVLVDTSGSFDPFVRACIEASTLTLVVSSGDVSSVRDTALAAKRLQQWGVPSERVRYVLNGAGAEQRIGPDRLAEALGHEVFWVIPYDRAVVDSVQIGQPLALRNANSKAALAMTRLARRIAGQSSEPESTNREPLWRRVLPLKGASDDDTGVEPVTAALDRR
ncbi:MAG: AAA family ATPase [Dehalococcoidia bacterium]